MNQFIIALIRTVVPALVGSLFGWLASVGLELDAETQGGLIVGLVAFFTGLYYAGVTWAASKWPAFGWLLGVARTPSYEPRHSSAPTVTVTLSPGADPEEVARVIANGMLHINGNVTVEGSAKFEK